MMTITPVKHNGATVGYYVTGLFNPSKNYFQAITTEHKFQTLTESNKPGVSHRKGIYLTPVTQKDKDLYFRLLRCSTNLDGPTENFKPTDTEVVTCVNHVARDLYPDSHELNHVLAQVYENSVTDGKQRKATIAPHSDKTKDMPMNGLMAFTTFYKDLGNYKLTQNGDVVYRGGGGQETSVLTRLRFRSKEDGSKFEVLLKPNSVLITPLSTNRLFTHEIVPSGLPVDKIPTRLGYVIRCSTTEAVHREGKNYILHGGKEVPLVPQYAEGVSRLKELYLAENKGMDPVEYGLFDFSLNLGDYLAPVK